MADRAKGYTYGWSPSTRRVTAKYGEVESMAERLAMAVDTLAEHRHEWPLTIRQLFYRMVALKDFPKTEVAYSRLCDAVTKARRAGMIDFDGQIRDDGLRETDVYAFRSFRSLLWNARRMIKEAVLNPDVGQPVHQLVMCEAQGMVPLLEEVASDYGVVVYSSGGFDGVKPKWDFAQKIAEDGRPAVVHHIGDYDPSGVTIYQAIEADIEAFLWQDAPDAEVTFNRVALTRELIDRHSIITAPPKRTDVRGGFTDTETAQCEALPSRLLQQLLREALEEHFDPDIYRIAKSTFEAEQAEYLEGDQS